MKILVLNGMPRSGKSTFCEYAFENRGQVYSMSTIDRIKQVALFAGWHGEKDAKSRKMLSDLKDLFTEYNDLPHQSVLNDMNYRLTMYEACKLPTENIIFIVESREPEDLERWENEYGARSVLVTKPGLVHEASNHADGDVKLHNYHYHIINNGDLDEWKLSTVGFIDKIRNEDWYSKGPGLNIWDEDNYDW